MQLRWELMLYKWLLSVNHWPYSLLLVYYLKFKCPLCDSQEKYHEYGMYKYFMNSKILKDGGKYMYDFQKNESINT